MQEKYIKINTLKVSEKLSQFISDELLKETDLSIDNFWSGFEKKIDELRGLANQKMSTPGGPRAWPEPKNRQNRWVL